MREVFFEVRVEGKGCPINSDMIDVTERTFENRKNSNGLRYNVIRESIQTTKLKSGRDVLKYSSRSYIDANEVNTRVYLRDLAFNILKCAGKRVNRSDIMLSVDLYTQGCVNSKNRSKHIIDDGEYLGWLYHDSQHDIIIRCEISNEIKGE